MQFLEKAESTYLLRRNTVFLPDYKYDLLEKV